MSNHDRDEELERERRRARWSGFGAGGASDRSPGVPGRTSLSSQLPAGSNGPYRGATLAFEPPDVDDAGVHAAAREGVSGAGSTLPHLDAIQRSFGHHDVSGVRAFIGGAAATASAEIGASAYATGDDVAFATAPDLRLAAHEAAHVVQQRGGVRLSGGVGHEGDAYERHADAVADLVVRGENAQTLLDDMAHRGSAGGPAVQRNPGDAARARRLRRVLEHRLHELDAGGSEGRAESSVEIERRQIEHALAQLDGERTPSHELVERLTHEHEERLRTIEDDAARAAADEAERTRLGMPPDVPPMPRVRYTPPDRTPRDLPAERELIHDVLRRRLEDPLASESELTQARLAMRDLESLSRDASHDELARVADAAGVDLSHADGTPVTLPGRIGSPTADADAAAAAGSPDGSVILPTGHDAPTADALDRVDTRAATAQSALRTELLRRAEDDSAGESSRALARLALDDLRDAGPEASMDELRRVADAAGVDLTEVEASAAERPGYTDGSVALDSIEVTHHDGDGGETGAELHVAQDGASVEASHEDADGHETSLGAGFALHHGASGVGFHGITGADATLSGGYGAMSGEITGGATYYADRPQRQADGSYRVYWRIEVRAGGELSRRLHPGGSVVTGGSVGGGASGHLRREGTDVFNGSTPDEALARAREFQQSFCTLDADALIARLERLATADLGSTEWWRTTAPVGTERRVEAALAASLELKGTVLGILSLGIGPEVEGTGAGKVKKVSDTHVDVEEELQVSVDAHPSAGAFGIGVDGLGMSGIPTRGSYKVTLTYNVAFEEGSAALGDFLAHRRLLDGTEPGVRLTTHAVEEEMGEGAGVRLGPLGHIEGSERTATITTTEYAADGTATERISHRATQDMTGNTITGAYTHRGMTVDAPESGGAYVATTDIHSTDGAESREMLGEETGTHGLSTDPATSSGHWVIREEMSQAEMREFHRRFLEHDSSTVGVGAYATLYERLRGIPLDETGDARRAEAITAFLSVEGRRGLQIIEGTGGFEVEQSLRLFGRDGEDMNFLSLTTLHQIEGRIEEYRAAAAEYRLGGLAEAIQADITLLEGPLAAVSDVSRYTDLPGELRERVCARYSGLLDQLRATISLVDDSFATNYSADTQGVYRLVSEERALVTHERSDTAEVRDRVLGYRRYYGQAPGHREATLDTAAAATTEAHWSSAETAFQEAERTVTDANARLAGARGAEELDAERAYREAHDELEHALHEYRQAHAELDQLVNLYSRATTATTASETAPTTDTASGTTTPTGETPPTSATAPATETAPTSEPVVVTPPTTTRRRRGAEGTAEHADHASEAPTPETTSTEPRAGIVLAQYLAPHIHTEHHGDLTDLAGHTTVDRGPARMPSGLVVELLSAHMITVVDESAREELGERHLYNVQLRITSALPGATAFLVPQLDGGAVNNATITNRVGVTFEAVVAC